MELNKNVGILFLVAIFAISIVSATVTLNVPASSATVSGGNGTHPIWNATISDASFHDVLNCTVWIKSIALTANTTYVDMNMTTNSSVNQSSFQSYFNSSLLEDGTDYSVFAQCKNATTQQNSSANTGITIDNTSPTAPSSITPSSGVTVTTSGTQSFSSTVVDGTTTSCTYTFYRGGSSADSASSAGSGSYSASTCSFDKAFTTSTDNGLYQWSITASDGTDTATSTGTMNVVLAGLGGGLPSGNYQQEGNEIVKSGTSPSPIIWIVAIVIIGLLIIKFRKSR